MPYIYESNERFIIELKKLMLENKITQRQIAETLALAPQGITKLFNKKNFGFEDAQKLLNAMGYTLTYGFQKLD